MAQVANVLQGCSSSERLRLGVTDVMDVYRFLRLGGVQGNVGPWRSGASVRPVGIGGNVGSGNQAY